jgi:hypothetical protein
VRNRINVYDNVYVYDDVQDVSDNLPLPSYYTSGYGYGYGFAVGDGYGDGYGYGYGRGEDGYGGGYDENGYPHNGDGGRGTY